MIDVTFLEIATIIGGFVAWVIGIYAIDYTDWKKIKKYLTFFKKGV